MSDGHVTVVRREHSRNVGEIASYSISSEEVTATNTEKSPLQIGPRMSLEEAMAEVRRYLNARGSLDRTPSQYEAGVDAALVQPRQFTLLGSSIARLSQVAARQGGIERNSKAGVLGVYLKRIIGKAIGWYSRPVYEFDHTVIEAFEQTRLDMQGLQQQINALTPDRSRQSAQIELLRSIIELLVVNIATVQSLRQALQDKEPDLQSRFEELLKVFESERADIKTTLLQLLPPELPGKK